MWLLTGVTDLPRARKINIRTILGEILSYNLKDLTGHGRFDIIPRCILAAGRRLVEDMVDEFLDGVKLPGIVTNTEEVPTADLRDLNLDGEDDTRG